MNSYEQFQIIAPTASNFISEPASCRLITIIKPVSTLRSPAVLTAWSFQHLLTFITFFLSTPSCCLLLWCAIVRNMLLLPFATWPPPSHPTCWQMCFLWDVHMCTTDHTGAPLNIINVTDMHASHFEAKGSSNKRYDYYHHLEIIVEP